MEIMKKIFKFIIASTLIISGLLLGGTIFATKKIDTLGDKLQQKLHPQLSNQVQH